MIFIEFYPTKILILSIFKNIINLLKKVRIFIILNIINKEVRYYYEIFLTFYVSILLYII